MFIEIHENWFPKKSTKTDFPRNSWKLMPHEIYGFNSIHDVLPVNVPTIVMDM